MAVLLTISETLDGAAVSDSLAGGGTGVDLGSVVNGQFAPITDKPTNVGAQNLYISHDAVIDPITDVKTFMQTYGVGTGFTYGGADSAANDFTTLKNQANASGNSKNNGDGNSGGLWIDMDADVTTVNQFDFATNGFYGWDGASFTGSQGGNDSVAKYGDGLTDGIDLLSGFPMRASAMVYNAPGETVASAPVEGKIGKAADTVLGDAAHVRLRMYLRSDFADGGIVQWEWVTSYSHTA